MQENLEGGSKEEQRPGPHPGHSTVHTGACQLLAHDPWSLPAFTKTPLRIRAVTGQARLQFRILQTLPGLWAHDPLWLGWTVVSGTQWTGNGESRGWYLARLACEGRGIQEVSRLREGLCWRAWGWGGSGQQGRREQGWKVRPL